MVLKELGEMLKYHIKELYKEIKDYIKAYFRQVVMLLAFGTTFLSIYLFRYSIYRFWVAAAVMFVWYLFYKYFIHFEEVDEDEDD